MKIFLAFLFLALGTSKAHADLRAYGQCLSGLRPAASSMLKSTAWSASANILARAGDFTVFPGTREVAVDDKGERTFQVKKGVYVLQGYTRGMFGESVGGQLQFVPFNGSENKAQFLSVPLPGAAGPGGPLEAQLRITVAPSANGPMIVGHMYPQFSLFRNRARAGETTESLALDDKFEKRYDASPAPRSALDSAGRKALAEQILSEAGDATTFVEAFGGKRVTPAMLAKLKAEVSGVEAAMPPGPGPKLPGDVIQSAGLASYFRSPDPSGPVNEDVFARFMKAKKLRELAGTARGNLCVASAQAYFIQNDRDLAEADYGECAKIPSPPVVAERIDQALDSCREVLKDNELGADVKKKLEETLNTLSARLEPLRKAGTKADPGTSSNIR